MDEILMLQDEIGALQECFSEELQQDDAGDQLALHSTLTVLGERMATIRMKASGKRQLLEVRRALCCQCTQAWASAKHFITNEEFSPCSLFYMALNETWCFFFSPTDCLRNKTLEACRCRKIITSSYFLITTCLEAFYSL